MKYCYKCGVQLNDEMVFCYNCGEKIVIPPSTHIHKPSISNTTPENSCVSNAPLPSTYNPGLTDVAQKTKTINENEPPISNPNNSNTPVPQTICTPQNDIPMYNSSNQQTTPESRCTTKKSEQKKRIAMGIAGMLLGDITLFCFSIPLAVSSGIALANNPTTLHQVVFWICIIPASVMTILSTIFSFVSRFRSCFKNYITRSGVLCSSLNTGIILFSILTYIIFWG